MTEADDAGLVNESAMDILNTDRLELRPLAPSDAEEMVSVLDAPALYEFTGGEAPSLATLRVRYEFQVVGPDDGSELWFNWIIRRVTDGVAVGFVQATVVERGADVAWLIGVDHQGQGFAVEAAQAMCDWLRAAGCAPITAHIHPNHAASQHVAAALGLERSDAVDDDGEEIWLR